MTEVRQMVLVASARFNGAPRVVLAGDRSFESTGFLETNDAIDQIGLENGGELSHVEAFSALGSYLTGATKVLDTVRVGE